jgi:hypothetical protein
MGMARLKIYYSHNLSHHKTPIDAKIPDFDFEACALLGSTHQPVHVPALDNLLKYQG